MATIGNDANGFKRILFVAPDRKRKTIRLGKATMKQATAFKVKLEALVAQTITGSLDDEVSRWLAGLDDRMYSRLAAAGLVKARQSVRRSLGAFLDGYIVGRTDVKPRTRINLDAARRRLVEFFGADKPLDSITIGDAKDWEIWLKARYARGTIGRTIKRAKQFFQAAIDKELLAKNPFAKIKPPSQVNEARLFFVTQETTHKVLEACPDAEWRLIVALCRFGGVRCPSELLPLCWSEVDWERGRFLVHSPKTEHHEGGADRWVPIFPELRPYLEEAFELASEGAVHLITRYRDSNSNLRTQLTRIIRRAGLEPWEKLFQNMRSTRETELAETYPVHVVCAWIGNSERIAAKHYLQVTEEHFAAAAQKAAQSGAERGCQGGTSAPEESEKALAGKGFHARSTADKTSDYPQGDSEQPPKTGGKPHPTDPPGTDSGTPPAAGNLDALAAALLNLSPADRARLAALLTQQPTGQGQPRTNPDTTAPQSP